VKNTNDIRRENAMRLFESAFESDANRMAEKLEVSVPFVRRILKANAAQPRNIGNSLARKIEQAAKVPPNWLDQDHTQTHVGDLEGKTTKLSPGMYRLMNAATSAELVPDDVLVGIAKAVEALSKYRHADIVQSLDKEVLGALAQAPSPVKQVCYKLLGLPSHIQADLFPHWSDSQRVASAVDTLTDKIDFMIRYTSGDMPFVTEEQDRLLELYTTGELTPEKMKTLEKQLEHAAPFAQAAGTRRVKHAKG
jgi:hypothetical protein